jgi:DNA (cytosine-5)-methyltransferase 1
MNKTFYDAFAGIGGMRQGMERAGFSCVGGCEIDTAARQTYARNFGEEPPDSDILWVKKLPRGTDILCGGFPCQAFSMIGKREGLMRPEGRLFYELDRLLEVSKPKGFLFENVKGLLSDDRGMTFFHMVKDLTRKGYHVVHAVLNASDFGLPQSRERLFVVGFRSSETAAHFCFPDGKVKKITLDDIMEHGRRDEVSYACLREYMVKMKQRGKGNGGRFQIAYHTPDEVCSTITTKPSAMVLDGKVIRHLTPGECARAQGFGPRFRLPESKTQAYKQVGNAVPIPVVAAIARNIMRALDATKGKK